MHTDADIHRHLYLEIHLIDGASQLGSIVGQKENLGLTLGWTRYTRTYTVSTYYCGSGCTSERHHASRCHIRYEDTTGGGPHPQGTHTEGRTPQRTHHRRGGPHRGPTQNTHRQYSPHRWRVAARKYSWPEIEPSSRRPRRLPAFRHLALTSRSQSRREEGYGTWQQEKNDKEGNYICMYIHIHIHVYILYIHTYTYIYIQQKQQH